MERLKTDTQETKKKVLGGNTSGKLLNLVFREQTRRNRNNQMICLCSNCGQTCGQKIFGISGGAEVVEKYPILPLKRKK